MKIKRLKILIDNESGRGKKNIKKGREERSMQRVETSGFGIFARVFSPVHAILVIPGGRSPLEKSRTRDFFFCIKGNGIEIGFSKLRATPIFSPEREMQTRLC